MHVSWDATDPNQDRLNFNLFLQKLPGSEWVLLRGNIQEKWLYLDSELFADGKYLLKVQADDALDNTPAWIKNASKISSPFIIDSTAPVLSGFSYAGGKVAFSAAMKPPLCSWSVTRWTARIGTRFFPRTWSPIPKPKNSSSP